MKAMIFLRKMAKAVLPFYLFTLLPMMTSCQDMLETESNLQIFDPGLDQKTDSMFYTLGILKGVQQAIDQYVLFNEMRGELTTVNHYTSSDLRALANFSANTENNKYDSAYVFYRIINNCNYFIQHRDTTLLTGARKVAMPEYVQAHSIRAWAYLQLAKMYGEVPFFTEPITNISEANAVSDNDKKNIYEICDALAPQLKYYADSTALATVPDYNGDTPVDVGSSSATGDKTVHLRKIFFPVGLVLGDFYLETGQYENAAKCYFKYLNDNKLAAGNYSAVRELTDEEHLNWPEFSFRGGRDWDMFFTSQDPKDIKDVITYVPMAVNKLQGQITDLPRLFGYDMYSMGVTSRYLLKREIEMSQTYRDLSKNQDYYYTVKTSTNTTKTSIDTAGIGDIRLHETLRFVSKDDSTFYEMKKYERGNIFIYRTSTIYLRLAEALNRMGYSDAAFAILKDGFNEELEADSIYLKTNSTYLSKNSRDMLRSIIPFYSTENKAIFAKSAGIHSYGTGETGGRRSPYQLDSIAYAKYLELQKQFGEEQFPSNIIQEREVLDEEGNPVLDEEDNPITQSVYVWPQETLINVIEDLICDEYALELAFEGHRFGDLCRLARHKNEAATYGSDFGSRWLAQKLAKKNPVVDLTVESNWYLKMKK